MGIARKTVLVSLLTANLGLGLAWAQQPTMTADERAIRAADAAWSQAAGSKDLDKTLSFYADSASMLPYSAPIATGKDRIRQVWSQLMAEPGFGLSFGPTKISVAKSGDMAYEIGAYDLKLNDAQGNPTSTVGKYVVVWKKQPTHDWKAVVDIFNTDK
jgi:ketosteroid isomerase-like protein